jgi:hypothetical protein
MQISLPGIWMRYCRRCTLMVSMPRVIQRMLLRRAGVPASWQHFLAAPQLAMNWPCRHHHISAIGMLRGGQTAAAPFCNSVLCLVASFAHIRKATVPLLRQKPAFECFIWIFIASWSCNGLSVAA